MTYLTSIIALCLLGISGGTVALGPGTVNLGTSANYVILAKSAVSNVPSSVITGDIGLSPASGTFFTGFALSPPTTFSTSAQVTGKLYAANYAAPTPSILTTAISNMQTAYVNAMGLAPPDFLNLGSGNIGGLVLVPGLYKWTSGVNIGSSVTISGSATDTWVFQVSGTLIEAPGVSVFLSGGALAKNVVWAVAGAVTIGAGSRFEGILLADTSVTLNTGASIEGRILSQTAVTLQKATVFI